jgi:predicted glycosyltransferase
MPDRRASAPRIAVFTHDTFGLGHLRRCTHIVRALAERAPEAAILFITGSPVLHAFDALPPNADFLKIPTVVKAGTGHVQPPHLPVGMAQVIHLRERILERAIETWAPDVLLVDNFPLGSQRELVAALQQARRLGTRTILGLRDILDAPHVVRNDWTRQGIDQVLERFYDRILVYGMREVLDLAQAYELPPAVADRLVYCGYVTAAGPPPELSTAVRAELGIEQGFVLATAGGGGDGFPLLDTFVRALKLVPDTPALVLTGPLMSGSERKRLAEAANGRSGVTIRDFVQDLPSYLTTADVVVSMCGYNIAAEIVAARSNAVVVPRTWRYGEHAKQSGEEWEQLLRARELARLGLVDLIEPGALSPQQLASQVIAARARARPATPSTVDLGGLATVADHILGAAQA